MPVKKTRLHHSSLPKHKHTKLYMQTYWPYIPKLLMVLIVTFFANPLLKNRSNGVKGYTVNASSSSLLSATNSQRSSSHVATLQLNSKLSKAAQSKANDMVKKDYWSHVTPDGRQPWVFIQNAGYQYQKAGENLAYGFSTSSDTVSGWMNSPSHRANLLDKAYTQVGFGIANSEDFNNSGPETVIVAMYGEPEVLGTTTQKATPLSNAASSTSSPHTSAKLDPKTPAKTTKKDLPVTTASLITQEPDSVSVTTAQRITKGNMPWLTFVIGLICGMGVFVLLVRHSLSLKHFTKKGRKMISHHPVLDFGVFSLILIGYLLSQTSGIIR